MRSSRFYEIWGWAFAAGIGVVWYFDLSEGQSIGLGVCALICWATAEILRALGK